MHHWIRERERNAKKMKTLTECRGASVLPGGGLWLHHNSSQSYILSWHLRYIHIYIPHLTLYCSGVLKKTGISICFSETSTCEGIMDVHVGAPPELLLLL